MPLTDLGTDDLVDHQPRLTASNDFDAFGCRTLAEVPFYDGTIKAERVTSAHLLPTVEVDDIRFPGWTASR
ncbi:hypothetical protein ACHGLA_04310 [Streptomyces sp. YH02]|uniref:hypothetical protein n=1 Tax=Streptomyces sp. YH02 TaxID=3256999 RepID=UPI0037582F9C